MDSPLLCREILTSAPVGYRAEAAGRAGLIGMGIGS
jgi:hypothetical protein